MKLDLFPLDEGSLVYGASNNVLALGTVPESLRDILRTLHPTELEFGSEVWGLSVWKQSLTRLVKDGRGDRLTWVEVGALYELLVGVDLPTSALPAVAYLGALAAIDPKRPVILGWH